MKNYKSSDIRYDKNLKLKLYDVGQGAANYGPRAKCEPEIQIFVAYDV